MHAILSLNVVRIANTSCSISTHAVLTTYRGRHNAAFYIVDNNTEYTVLHMPNTGNVYRARCNALLHIQCGTTHNTQYYTCPVLCSNVPCTSQCCITNSAERHTTYSALATAKLYASPPSRRIEGNIFLFRLNSGVMLTD